MFDVDADIADVEEEELLVDEPEKCFANRPVRA